MDKYRMTNRINLLRARELGFEHSFVNIEQTRRLTEMILCKYRNLTAYHRSSVSSMDLDQSEYRYLLSGGANGHICCHDMFPSRLVAQHPILFQIDKNSSKDHHTHTIASILWYPNDNGLFVTLGFDKRLKIWDTNRLQMVDEYQFSDFAYAAHMPSTSHTSMVALAHNNGDLRFIDIRTGSNTHIIHANHGKGVGLVKWFNNNPHLLASGGIGGRVLFTDIRSPRTCYMSLDRDHILTDRPMLKARPSTTSVAHQGGIKSLQFLPDNTHLLTLAGDDQMYLWNIHHGQRILINYGSVSTDKSRIVTIGSAQMKHDRSKSVVYVPCGKTIRIYDVFSGQRLANLTGHLRHVNTCIYNPLSVELYSSSDDILVWAAVKKQQEQYENNLKTVDYSNSTTRSLGQILNRDQWSDDEQDDM